MELLEPLIGLLSIFQPALLVFHPGVETTFYVLSPEESELMSEYFRLLWEDTEYWFPIR